MNMEQLLKMPLYDALKTAEKRNCITIGAENVKAENGIKEYEGLPGYEERCVQRIFKIDVPKLQREIIDTHRNNNHFLDEVIKSKDTFVNIVDGLYKRKHVGWRAWFPIRTDESYNNEVGHLNEIVNADFMKIRQMAGPDPSEMVKPVAYGSLGVLSAMLIKCLGELYNHLFSQRESPTFTAVAGICVGSLLLTSGLAHIVKCYKFKELSKKAEYLDKKIEEMYK